MENKAKMAAAIAAVTAYMKSGEEAMAMASAPPAPAEPEIPARTAPPSPWGTSARLDQMALRGMMQLKAFHGVKFR